jgi:flagellar hook protein FlgE
MAVGSFSAGLSGLNANGTYLSVIGNNLANINTIGFKSSVVSFQDLVSQTVGGDSLNPLQVGLGVTTGSITPVFSQGAIENTREATNVAIQGGGFLVVADADGSQAYTRAGNFSFDKDGKLVTPDGHFVQGWDDIDPVTGEVLATGQPGDLSVPPGILRAPLATSTFTTETNLNANAAAGSTFTAAVQIYDALGSPHVATLTYTKQAAAGSWNYAVSVPGEDVAGGTPGTPVSIGTGSLAFNSSGLLGSVNGGAPADINFSLPAWTNGATASTLSWNIVEPDGSATLSGFAITSATSSIRQNGSAPGTMDNITIGPDGTITATFGAGQAVNIGQLALATFNNPKGLVKLGSNLYGVSAAAGIPNVGEAGTGGRGTLIGSALEQSNVDIAQEFTQMILAQRGYQANSKTITVSDELLVETLNLKR